MKQEKQIKKLHRTYDRLRRLIGDEKASEIVNRLINKGLEDGQITRDEALEFKKELAL